MSSLTFLLPTPAFMSFGFTEILVVGVVALLVFGGNLPDVMRTLGRSYGKFRQGLEELSRPVRAEIQKVRDLPPAVDLSSPEQTTASVTPEETSSNADEDPAAENAAYPPDVYAPGDENEELAEDDLPEVDHQDAKLPDVKLPDATLPDSNLSDSNLSDSVPRGGAGDDETHSV